ncbi:diaminopimelate decarboxylase [Acinetobacter sp. HY1485]|uniref:diaminopimelate decarboxylase n=1 Tax=Acinetobacter sp. HY1485 TaxID=2970918 RepID=UPI0022B98EE2|nr:diaminopimelate decarboxylase [Acinetobacter sp. HY1485]
MKNWIPEKNIVKNVIDQYDTPVFLYDYQSIKENFLEISKKLENKFEVFYSLKANPNVSIIKSFIENGAGLEVSSLTELESAIFAGAKPENIIFVGPCKTESEIERAIQLNILAIICESLAELFLIQKIANNLNTNVQVMIRVNPAFEASGSALAMGGKPRQFGIDEEFLYENKSLFLELKNVQIIGLHYYVGTRFLNHSDIITNTEKIFESAEKLEKHFNMKFQIIDIGGGWGVPYYDNEKDLNRNRLTEGLVQLAERYKKNRDKNVKLIIELGRYLIAPHGILLTQAKYIKSSRDVNFVVIDGGTNVNLGSVGLGTFVKRNFPIKNLTNDNSIDVFTYNLAGPLCTPTDTVAKNISFPQTKVGDVIATLAAGAYGPTASPVYFLGHGYPAEVLFKNGKLHLIRERDTYNDLLKKQILV